MSRAGKLGVVGGGINVKVRYHGADGRACGVSVEKTADYGGNVRFLASAGYFRACGGAAGKLLLDLLHIYLLAHWKAVKHHTDGIAVGFSENRKLNVFADCVHSNSFQGAVSEYW